MFVEDLTEIDYQILKFFKENGSVSIENAQKALSDIESIEYRIKALAKPERKLNIHIYEPIPDTCCLEEDREKYREGNFTKYKSLGTFHITTLGKKVLQDHEITQIQHRKDMWLQNAKIPILVTLVTNLVIDGTKWLLPLILQSLSNTP